MSKDQLLGASTFFGSITGIAAYLWLVFLSPWAWLTIQLSVFAAVDAVMLIVAWIGYTLATTPPPTPLNDLNLDFNEEEPEEEEKTP